MMSKLVFKRPFVVQPYLSCFFRLYIAVVCLTRALHCFCRWNDINNMTHNKSFFALELANKEDTIQFQTVSLHLISDSSDAFLCLK